LEVLNIQRLNAIVYELEQKDARLIHQREKVKYLLQCHLVMNTKIAMNME
jgi:hypothetical protein